MKAALALLLTAGPALAQTPVVRLTPGAVSLAPLAAAAAPLSVSYGAPGLVSPVFGPALTPALSAPSLAPAFSPVAASLRPSSEGQAVKALPALSALSVLPAPAIGDAFDGAYAERREKKAEAVQHAHAEIPVVDWRRGAYSKEGAAETMGDRGRELLSILVTPEALHPDLTPDPDRVDFSRLGKTSAEIRALLEGTDVPYHAYERWLKTAFRDGLIYRLFNKNTGLTYYGVPPQVRADWSLEAPVSVETRTTAAKTVPRLDELALFANESADIDDAEIFEFTAQAVAAAVKEGRLAPDSVSAPFRERAAKIDFDAPSLRDALLTLSESAEGTPWEARTAALLALLD